MYVKKPKLSTEDWIIKYYKKKKNFIHYFTAGTIALLGAFIINSLFIDVFEASKVAALLWIIIGVNLSAEKIKI